MNDRSEVLYWLFDFYAACFCAKDDVLSQWRGYAGMGNGYALAIFREELETDKDITALRFRDVSGRIVPYIEVDFSSPNKPNVGKLPIEAVRHGPALIPELANKALSLLFQKYGYQGLIYVEGSDVPLRP